MVTIESEIKLNTNVMDSILGRKLVMDSILGRKLVSNCKDYSEVENKAF
ncbi:hypothetical protein CCACVL1_21575 [Corchorus capsularis]|uniref:Uncharacterized protein n=1 Tax=Corchorus capsularis TaxID=210143 RepID=A0A1R3H4K4_COCAP|nr:hypothetical protein CCACVL1_21575 [Corchorus capsularis]